MFAYRRLAATSCASQATIEDMRNRRDQDRQDRPDYEASGPAGYRGLKLASARLAHHAAFKRIAVVPTRRGATCMRWRG